VGRWFDSSRVAKIANRSDIDLDRQVTSPDAARHGRDLARGVCDAATAPTEYLAAEGLAHRQGPRIVPKPHLLAALRRCDLDAAGASYQWRRAMHPISSSVTGRPLWQRVADGGNRTRKSG
jgi:hypothetical protein